MVVRLVIYDGLRIGLCMLVGVISALCAVRLVIGLGYRFCLVVLRVYCVLFVLLGWIVLH